MLALLTAARADDHRRGTRGVVVGHHRVHIEAAQDRGVVVVAGYEPGAEPVRGAVRGKRREQRDRHLVRRRQEADGPARGKIGGIVRHVERPPHPVCRSVTGRDVLP